MLLPDDLPELLGLLAYELRRALAALLRGRADADLDRLALALAWECSNRIGGHRLPVAAGVAATDLPAADYGYAALSDAWADMLVAESGMPQQWVHVAVVRLLQIARDVLGSQYVPKGTASRLRAQRLARDEAMWNDFRGSFREVGIAHGISSERARQVISQRLRAERAARQRNLFDDE